MTEFMLVKYIIYFKADVHEWKNNKISSVFNDYVLNKSKTKKALTNRDLWKNPIKSVENP